MACFRQGSVWSSIPKVASSWLSIKFWACPKIPNPVTSVHAVARYFFMSLAATRFNRTIEQMASWIKVSAVCWVKTPFSRVCFQNLWLFCLHWWTFAAIWVPNGFVNSTTSPSWAPLDQMNSDDVTTDVATPPIIGHGFKTVCPPVIVVPAWTHASRNPWTMVRVQIRRSSSGISRQDASSINTKSHRSTPWAYKSDKTLAAPIHPWTYGLSTKGKKKSVVLIEYRLGCCSWHSEFVSLSSSFVALDEVATLTWRILQSNAIFPPDVPKFPPSPKSRSCNMVCNSDWGTLQAHPFKLDQSVNFHPFGRPIEVGSKWIVSCLVGI